jgi:hypothetical protein
VRASGTLQYPTIASMYLEIVFALGLGALLWAIDVRATVAAAALFLGLAVIAEGVIVTLTRAGLMTMAASLLAVGLWRFSTHRVDRGMAALAGVAAAIVLLLASSASVESLRLRLTTEGQRDWYHAGFQTPASLDLDAGSLNAVEVTVINRGLVTWNPEARPAFHLSYHWFDEAMRTAIGYDGLRTPLPRAVPPGDSLNVVMEVRAPKAAGRYRLGWDVVQEGRLWFSTEPGSRLALSTVTVSGTASTDDSSLRFRGIPMPTQAVRVGRPALWLAALRMFAAHPLLGIGPDNYRLSYGPYARLADPDPRVTSNNMYLEILTGTGLAGLAIFGWLCWRAQASIRHTRRALDGPAASLYAGVAAAALAVALHGLVDSFLTLTPTYLVISLTLGLAMAPLAWTKEGLRADCV